MPLFCFVQCQKATQPLKIGVISDLHLLSSSLQDGGEAVTALSNRTGKNIVATPEVMREAISILSSSNLDVVLFPGDLTSEGERESHIELKNNLDKLKAKGTKVFVIPGNHDINNPSSKGFKGKDTFQTPNVSPEEFAEIYTDFGYNDALGRDEKSLSYVAELNDSVWVMGIDVAQYEPGQNRSIGKLKPETETWIFHWLNEAKKQNKTVLPMMHWSLLEHIPMQSVFFPNYIVQNSDVLSSKLADSGIETIFTGHFHANDIKKHTTFDGNSIYDIATGATVSFPYAVRLIDYHDGRMEIETKHIESTPSFPNLRKDSKDNLTKIAESAAVPYLSRINNNLGSFEMSFLKKLAANYFISNMNGEAKLEDETIITVQKMFKKMGYVIENDYDAASLSQLPSNNTTIHLKKKN